MALFGKVGMCDAGSLAANSGAKFGGKLEWAWPWLSLKGSPLSALSCNQLQLLTSTTVVQLLISVYALKKPFHG